MSLTSFKSRKVPNSQVTLLLASPLESAYKYVEYIVLQQHRCFGQKVCLGGSDYCEPENTLLPVVQGGVFLLQRADGSTDPDQVLKVVFKFGIGGVFGMTNLEREWRVGRHLALLTEPGEALPGFMGTGAGIVTNSGRFMGKPKSSSCVIIFRKIFNTGSIIDCAGL